jgi:hypothetical protein
MSHEFLSRCDRDDLAANDLVFRKGLGVTVDSFSAQSRRGEDPSPTVALRELDGSAPQGWQEWAFARSPARAKNKFVDDHVGGADKPGGVADRRDCELQR